MSRYGQEVSKSCCWQLGAMQMVSMACHYQHCASEVLPWRHPMQSSGMKCHVENVGYYKHSIESTHQWNWPRKNLQTSIMVMDPLLFGRNPLLLGRHTNYMVVQPVLIKAERVPAETNAGMSSGMTTCNPEPCFSWAMSTSLFGSKFNVLSNEAFCSCIQKQWILGHAVLKYQREQTKNSSQGPSSVEIKRCDDIIPYAMGRW